MKMYTSLMLPRASRIIATVALLVCLVCSLLETFDTWDHTVQTGNDIEYALVILALCVGVAYSFARFILRSGLLVRFVAKRVFAFDALKSSLFKTSCFTLLRFDDTSPPLLPLRI